MTNAGTAHAASAPNPLPTDSTTGSLTVTKLASPDSATGLPNNGTQQDTSGLTPLSGAVFKVTQVTTVDLTTNQGWADASALQSAIQSSLTDNASAESAIKGASVCGANGTSACSLGSGTSQTTGSNGAANFSSLPLGLYLVEETQVPTKDANGNPISTTQSIPFLVTVPMTDPTNKNQWNYNIYAYPKDAVVKATKKVSDADALVAGQNMTFTIDSDIPNRSGNVNPTTVTSQDAYRVTDTLDTKLNYQSTTVKIIDSTGATTETLTAGSDYTLTAPAAGSTGTVTVEFTAAGLAKLYADDAKDAKSQVETTITAQANAEGTISNTATVYPDKPSENNGNPPAKTNTTTSKYDDVTVQKQDMGGNAILKAATFKVYPNNTGTCTDPTSYAETGQGALAAYTDAALKNQSTTFTTSTSDGTVTIYGLHDTALVNDSTSGKNGRSTIDPGENYCLVEVTAPTGYQLLAEPIQFDASQGLKIPVKDPKDNAGFPLPLTGGPGVTLVYLAGLLLLASAGAVTVGTVRRRQKN